MANSLFNSLGGGQNASPFGNNPMGQQFTNFVNSLNASVRQNPYQMVQNLINTGRMSPAQFEQLRQLANQATGKNY